MMKCYNFASLELTSYAIICSNTYMVPREQQIHNYTRVISDWVDRIYLLFNIINGPVSEQIFIFPKNMYNKKSHFKLHFFVIIII